MYHWHCVQCRDDEYVRQNPVREAGCAAIGILHCTSLLHSAVPVLLFSRGKPFDCQIPVQSPSYA